MNTQTKLAIVAIIVIVPLVSILVYGTSSNDQFIKTNSPQLKVISSFYSLHEFSQYIGKEKIDAILLVPIGVEPHDWEPTIKDVQVIQSSDLIIINGIGFENWIDDIDANNFSGTIVDTSNGILLKSITGEHVDSHIWLNPVYAKIQVQNIANAFSNSDPKNKNFYQSNADDYIKQLDDLDSKIKNELNSCNTDFITFHNAFSFFADEYGLTQHAIIQSNDSHGEITAKTLENIISLARELDIKIVFSEETTNQKTLQVIADEINGKILILSPLEVVSDKSYISKMTQNLKNLKEALC